MRHRLKGRKLGRTTAHRQAMERNLVTSLLVNGRVVTTVTRAKEFRGTAERLITLGKRGGLANFRRILSVVQDRKVARKVVNDLAKRFADRPGGYTRILKLGASRWDGDGRGNIAHNRLGDNAPKAFWELVVRHDADEERRLAGRGKLAAAEEEKRRRERKGGGAAGGPTKA